MNEHVSRRIRRSWALTFVALTAVVALVPNVTNRTWVVVLMAALIPVQLVWHRIFPTGAVTVSRILHDCILCLLVAAISPSLWFSCVIVFAIAANSVIREDVPGLVRVSLVFTGVGLAVVGAANGKDAWLATAITVVVLVALRVVVVESVWKLLSKTEKDLADVLESVSAVLFTADPSIGRVTWVTPNIERITGWTLEEWIDVPPRDLIHADDFEHFWIPFEDMHVGQEYDRYARHLHKDGHWIWLNVSSRIVLHVDGEMIMRGHYTDASELVAAQTAISELARRDEVTGLANRYVLLSSVDEHLREHGRAGLLMLDVDRFKEVNDTFGHKFGDDVLRELAVRISANAPGELVCRLGGDEFAVLIANPLDVARVADQVSQACAEPMRFGDLTVATQVSIGSAVAPTDGDNTEDLMRRGDIAMYQAKRRRQAHVEFVSELERTSSLELELSATLGEALANGQFEVFFQPKVELVTGNIVGAEGLVRWRHPEQGLLRPGAFIHLMALSNEQAAFTDSVVDQAIAFAALAGRHGMEVPVAINISMASLFDAEFPSRVADALRRHQVEATQVTMEVTEDDIMDGFDAILPVIDALTQLGVNIAIDDFGTGYSSLARLVDLPVAEIKIDRRFVTGALDQERERAVIESIIGLAGRLNLSAVAEGIESHEQAELMVEFGCQVGQGFLYGHAVEADELLERIAAQDRSNSDRTIPLRN